MSVSGPHYGLRRFEVSRLTRTSLTDCFSSWSGLYTPRHNHESTNHSIDPPETITRSIGPGTGLWKEGPPFVPRG